VSPRLRAFVLALIALLGGCSSTRLAYNNADLMLRWRATSFLDVHGAQSDELDARIASFLAWHRRHALPQYVTFAREAAARVERGPSRADLVWGYDAFVEQARESVRAAAAEIADLLDTLTPEQIEHLEQRIAEDNRKFAAENLAGTERERREARRQRNVERLEEWLGTLTESQLERVKRYSERAPLVDELRDRDRRQRQAVLLAMVRARESSRRLADWAAGWDRGRDPAYEAAYRAHVEQYLDMLFDVARALTPEQRLHWAARLRGLAGDLAYLANQGAVERVSR
jgi:hypothetical protein